MKDRRRNPGPPHFHDPSEDVGVVFLILVVIGVILAALYAII